MADFSPHTFRATGITAYLEAGGTSIPPVHHLCSNLNSVEIGRNSGEIRVEMNKSSRVIA